MTRIDTAFTITGDIRPVALEDSLFFAGIETFRRRLDAGEVLHGIGIAVADPQVTEAIADAVDFLWIDLEHGALGPEPLRAHLLAARARRRAIVVRTVGSDTAHIKPILDAGAPGIVVPQVASAEEVAHVVADCRYPPVGCRGFGPMLPSDYGRQGDGYVERANRAVFASVMIERVEAVEAIEDIVAIDGLDAIVLGPHDLSGSLGVLGQVEHPDVVDAMERVIAAARARNLPVGSGMPVDTAFAARQIERGVQWLQVGGDLSYLRDAVESTMATLRQLPESAPQPQR